MLDSALKGQLAAYLDLLEGPVVFKASLGDDKISKDIEEFLEEVSSLSDRLSVEKAESKWKPSFEICRGQESMGVRFAGLPMGHEFESFVLALLQVSGRPPKIRPDQVERIKAIDEEIELETIVSLGCHNCPDVVQALNIMAVLNPKISHTMIEGSAYQDLVDQRGVMAVPSVFKNGQEFHGGRISFDQLLEKLVGSAAKPSLADRDPFDLLIIGGGPAAGAAGIYAARKGIRTGIVCTVFGGQVNETLGIENIIGTSYIEGPKFMAQVKDHVGDYEIDLMEGYEATSLRKDGEYVIVSLDNGDELKTKSLVIATGARWRQLGIPGEKEFKNKGVAYCPHCDGPLFRGKKVAVIGGGNSGIEAAIDLAGLAKEVVVLEFADKLNADEVLQKRLKSLSNVEVVTSAQTSAIEGDGKVKSLSYKDRETGRERTIELDGVFVQVGLVPNTEWTKDFLEKTRMGEIIVQKDGSSSMEGVFAAGDCSDQLFKQIIISMGSGATAALGAFNYLIRKG